MVVKKMRGHTLGKSKHARQISKHKMNKREVVSVVSNNPKNQKAAIIAQEIKYARLLAGNDKKVRDKVLKNLKKWLSARSSSSFPFTETDFMRLWKGLFYCMWMSDKPLIQEELAESLSGLIHCFNTIETALLYTECTLKTLATEWFGIDRYRLDKFEMLVRRVIRQSFVFCKKQSWSKECVKGFAKVIERLIQNPKFALGFNFHLSDLYLEELSKISHGQISTDTVTELIRPFAIQLASVDDDRQIAHITRHIFRHLIFQSDVGMDYLEKFEAWKNAGFPEGNIDAIQKCEISDEDTDSERADGNDSIQKIETKPLDPRAGRVDVELPQIPFDAEAIARVLLEYKFRPSSTTKSRKQIVKLSNEFTEVSKGIMPLGMKELRIPKSRKADTNPKKAALRLLKFDDEIYIDAGRSKRRKRTDSETSETEVSDLLEESREQGKPKKNSKKDSKPQLNGETHSTDENVNSECESIDEFAINTGKKVKRKRKQNAGNDGGENCKSHSEEKESDKSNSEDPSIGKEDSEKNGISEIQTQPSCLKGKVKKAKLMKGNVIGKSYCRINEDDDSVVGKDDTIKSCAIKSQKLQTYLLAKGKISKLKSKKSRAKIDFTRAEIREGILNFKNFVTPRKNKLKKSSPIGKWDVSDTEGPTISISLSKKKHITVSDNMASNVTNSDSGKLQSTISATDKASLAKIPWLMPVLTKLEDDQKLNSANKVGVTSSPSSKKRVKIALQRNTAQHTSEYIQQIRQSPAIPFDANRKPPAGVLKPSPLSSPVNPFYRGFIN